QPGGGGPGRGFGRGGFPGFGPSPEEVAAEAARKEAEKIEGQKAMLARAVLVRRLAQYNQAVLATRQAQKPKAVVSLYNMLAALKPGTPVDEMVLNAERSLLFGQLDEAARKGIGLLPQITKTMVDQDKALAAAAYKGSERFGIAWVPIGSASQLRQAGKAEVYVAELPFVLPDNSVLKGKKAGAAGMYANALLPDVVDGMARDVLASAGLKPLENTPVAGGPTTGPAAGGPGALARSDRPTGPLVLGSGGTAPAPGDPVNGNPPVALPTLPGEAGPASPTLPGSPAAPAAPVATTSIEATVTLRGAAFCVAPGVMATLARHVQGASSIKVVDTEDAVATAEVLAVDEASGLALLKLTGGNYKPMPLGDALKPGAVHVACFAKAALFNPDLDVLKGDVVSGGAGKPFVLRTSQHPRSAGAPVFDDHGKVVGIVSAGRDDPTNALGILPVDGLRKLLAEKVGPQAVSAVTTSVDPDDAVGEMTAVRRETKGAQ
ncbi:MAG TPA: serine protease, partial [Humisphaera sp.]